MHEEAKRGKQLLLVLALVTISFATSFVASNAASAPTMDLTTTSNVAGATASYAFHVENPTSGSYIAFSVTIPAAYAIDPAYLTTTPDIVVPGFTGSFGPAPLSGSLTVKTTTTSGQFRIFALYFGLLIEIGSATIVPPTLLTAGTVSGLLYYQLGYALGPSMYVDLNVVVINPSAPGVYTWGPNTITPLTITTLSGGAQGAPVPMNPRTGYTNQVVIVGPVGGILMSLNKTVIVAPYLALFGVIAAVAVAVAKPWKKPEN